MQTRHDAAMARDDGFDYDWLVIGSGFGGSVAALRLAQKGYRYDASINPMLRRFAQGRL